MLKAKWADQLYVEGEKADQLYVEGQGADRLCFEGYYMYEVCILLYMYKGFEVTIDLVPDWCKCGGFESTSFFF